MKPTLLCCRKLTALLFLFLSFSAFAQLSPFTLTVTPTPQTCFGNGSLSFIVGGTTAGATISYEVYLLPNTTSYVAVTNNTSVGSLSAGNYLVKAIQTLGTLTSTQTANVTILNNVVPFSFSVTPGNVTCNNNGSITVTTTSGTAASYEIVSGPMIRAAQVSNVFTGLAPGIYRVRVFDICGEADTRDVTLTQVATQINISPVSFPGGPLPSCTTIAVENAYASPVNINVIYPLTLRYTVYPPGGAAPVVVTTTIPSGANLDVAQAVLPFYYDQQYTFNLSIIDGCGNTFVRNNNIINEKLEVELTADYPGCSGIMLTVTPNNFVAPYTLSFTQAPAGFDPETYNPTQPTFSSDTAEFGSDTNPLPEGDYTVQVTDACGHTASASTSLEYPPKPPSPEVDAACGSTTGSVKIKFEDRVIVQITITVAAPGYSGPVPADLSAGIAADGTYTLSNVPQGNYVFTIIDNCGETHTLPVAIVPTAPVTGVTSIPRPGCDVGYGSIRIYGPEGTVFSGATITAAPDGFAVPLNISSNINTVGDTAGQIYMNGLPEGQYTIALTDQCNFTQTQVINVTGYHITTNNVTIIPHCGSFDVNLQHTSTGNYAQSFWLQKYDDSSLTWGHPQTGVAYTGGLPSAANSVIMNVNAINLNNAYSGHFRLLKVFYTYSNGVASNNRCIETIYEFDFDAAPRIIDVTSFPCTNGTVEAVVNVSGVPPFTYAITSMNGDTSFVRNNGTSNVFSGLLSGTYNFQVTDNCGNIRNAEFAINNQQPISILPIGFCEGQASSLSVPTYTFLNYQWYNAASPATILSTTATLNFPSYTSATEAGTYIVRIIASDPASCLNQTIAYTINPFVQPSAGTDATVSLCNDAAGTVIDLASRLGTHSTNGVWTDVDGAGGLTGGNFNTLGVASGTYHFKYTVTGACSMVDDATITVVLKPIPLAPVITPVASVCVGANVQLNTIAVTGATYSWTGPNGFTSSLQNPLLSSVDLTSSGSYSLTVTVNGCTSPAGTVNLTVVATPFAGADATDTLCNPRTNIDLFSYIGTGYTTGGTWTDLDASGALTGSVFNTAGVTSGTFRFRYFVTSPCGVNDDATVTITLNATPGAPVISPLPIVCAGSTVQLTTATVAGAVYSWTGPNGFTSSVQNPQLANATVNQSGTYTLTVTVNGCTSAPSSVNVTVSPQPNAGTDGADVLCNTGTTINLTSYLGTTYDAGGIWTDVDGSGALASGNFNATGVAQGVYHFKYTVTSACGAVDDAEVVITLNAIPGAPVISPLTVACAGSTVQLTAATVTGATYSWTGPNGFTSSLQNPQLTNVVVNQSGTYTLTLTVNGCTSAPATVNLTVSPLPNAGTNGSDLVCNTGSVINLTSYLGGTYDTTGVWSDVDGSGALSSGSFSTAGVAQGVYHFKYTVTSACGAVDDAEVIITLNDIPSAPAVTTVSPLCQGQNIQLNATAVSGAVYSWTGPNGFTSSLQNPVIASATTAASGTYSLTVTVNGCTSAAATVAVLVKIVPDYTVEGNAVLCAGQSTTLTVDPNNFNTADMTYVWYKGTDVLTATGSSLNVSDFGTYYVEVSNGTCTVTKDFTVSLDASPFVVTPQAGCEDFAYVIRVANYSEINDIASVTWSGPNGFSATGEWVDITGKAAGVYSVTVTQTGGCSRTATFTVDKTVCRIPKGISPGDGDDNENFDLSNLDVKHIKIFNRYGMTVYERYDYTNQWHGQSDKGDLPTGTYFYVVTLSEGKQVTGWVYLARKV